MSSENHVGIMMAENLRFLGEGSSAQGKPGAKARPKGVVDAHTVTLTLWNSRTRALVDPGVRDRTIVGKPAMSRGEKRCEVY